MKFACKLPLIASLLCFCMAGSLSVATAGPFSDKEYSAKKKLSDTEKKKEAKAAKAAKKKAAKAKGKATGTAPEKTGGSKVEHMPAEKELALLMEKHGDDPNAKGESGSPLFFEAVRDKKAELAQKLIEKGADVSKMDEASAQTPLYAAAASGSPELVKLILQKGVDVNAKNPDGETALCSAAKANDLETVRLLVEKGAAVDVKNAPPINYAVVNDNESMVRYLMSKGADIRATDKEGNTAIGLASKLGSPTITGLLMGTIH